MSQIAYLGFDVVVSGVEWIGTHDFRRTGRVLREG